MGEEALIVADAGPLIALSKIGQLTILEALYADVRVPDLVARELRASR